VTNIVRIFGPINITLTSTDQMAILEEFMSELSAEQQHIESDVTAIRGSVATAVAELKAQAKDAGVSLDFTSLDKLAADEAAEATADAPGVSVTGTGVSSAPGSAPGDAPAATSEGVPPVAQPDPAAADAAAVPPAAAPDAPAAPADPASGAAATPPAADTPAS
jgi:hypothetical protein